MYYNFMTNILFYNTFVRFYNYQGRGPLRLKKSIVKCPEDLWLSCVQGFLSYKLSQLYYCSLSDFANVL